MKLHNFITLHVFYIQKRHYGDKQHKVLKTDSTKHIVKNKRLSYELKLFQNFIL
jgi:hypothetical protein